MGPNLFPLYFNNLLKTRPHAPVVWYLLSRINFYGEPEAMLSFICLSALSRAGLSFKSKSSISVYGCINDLVWTRETEIIRGLGRLLSAWNAFVPGEFQFFPSLGNDSYIFEENYTVINLTLKSIINLQSFREVFCSSLSSVLIFNFHLLVHLMLLKSCWIARFQGFLGH